MSEATVPSGNSGNTTTKVNYIGMICLAGLFCILFLGGGTFLTNLFKYLSVGRVASVIATGASRLADDGDQAVFTDSQGNEIDTGSDVIDLSGADIPDTLSDPSKPINNEAQTAPNAVEATAVPAPAPAAAPRSSAYRSQDLPTAVVAIPIVPDVVIPKNLPDAARMPTATAIPTVAPPIPIDKGEYVFIDHGTQVKDRFCVQLPAQNKQICDGDVSMMFEDTQLFLARSMKIGTMPGYPIK